MAYVRLSVVKFRVEVWSDVGADPISLRCPGCRQIGVFDPMGLNDRSYGGSGVVAGQRRCPDRECLTHVFVLYGPAVGGVVAYPHELIEFATADIPDRIVEAMQEALECHANECYIAAAIMVRKTYRGALRGTRRYWCQPEGADRGAGYDGGFAYGAS